MKTIFLKPGELCITERSVILYTILGSCVSVTFFSRQPRLAAMCHAMLTEPLGKDPGLADRFRYLIHAISHMHERFAARGLSPKEVSVKVFGGADMFGRAGGASPEQSVGRKNIALALSMLDKLGYAIVSSDLGGGYGRKLYFHTDTGKVLMKRVAGGGPCELCSQS